MNSLVRRSLATGASLALAVCGGAWGIAQTQSSATQNQATPAQSQQNPATQTNTPNTQANPGAQTQAPAAQNPNTNQNPETNPNGTPADNSANTAQPQTRTLQMVPAKAELQKTLDAKKAKQGEPVTAKLSDDVQIPNAQTLPKNTVLEGHVDQTEVSQDKHGTSSVTVTFDKAKLKTGQEVPIKATVVAIAQPSYNTSQAGAPGAAPSGGAPMASSGGMAPGGGGSPNGGGAMGGGSAPSTPMPSQQMPSATEPGQSGGQPGGQVSGVQVKSDIHQPTSATFVQEGKNVHVSSGTQMEVALTIIPPGTHLQ
ncbi:MAG TPA: hypothetical protein VFJ10_16975 [Acidobacteriaceae bacterium]|jgi:hypothetical protein|nr:hypothetical protein [Acidobacteriaceae bacterium]